MTEPGPVKARELELVMTAGPEVTEKVTGLVEGPPVAERVRVEVEVWLGMAAKEMVWRALLMVRVPEAEPWKRWSMMVATTE